MKLHVLQHVPFEGPGDIGAWARSRHAEIQCIRLYDNEPLPSLSDVDLLVIMGGPMGIHDHAQHPWLAGEKEFIRQAIDAGRKVLGICLGAQLIADVLGAPVYAGPHKEIGWFPVRRSDDAPRWFPGELMVFHWHGDTFDLPEGAIRLASSEACLNQGFIYRDRVIALQFHLETTPESMEALLEHCASELVDAPFIQSAAQMRAGLSHLPAINALLTQLLDTLALPDGATAKS